MCRCSNVNTSTVTINKFQTALYNYVIEHTRWFVFICIFIYTSSVCVWLGIHVCLHVRPRTRRSLGWNKGWGRRKSQAVRDQREKSSWVKWFQKQEKWDKSSNLSGILLTMISLHGYPSTQGTSILHAKSSILVLKGCIVILYTSILSSNSGNDSVVMTSHLNLVAQLNY